MEDRAVGCIDRLRSRVSVRRDVGGIHRRPKRPSIYHSCRNGCGVRYVRSRYRRGDRCAGWRDQARDRLSRGEAALKRCLVVLLAASFCEAAGPPEIAGHAGYLKPFLDETGGLATGLSLRIPVTRRLAVRPEVVFGSIAGY